MGARQYLPGLGRFLQADPVEGGCSSAYTYVNDPISQFDLTGKKCSKTIQGAAGFLGWGDFGRIGYYAFRANTEANKKAFEGSVQGAGQDYAVQKSSMWATQSGKHSRGLVKKLVTPHRIIGKILGTPVAMPATALDAMCNSPQKKKSMAPAPNYVGLTTLSYG